MEYSWLIMLWWFQVDSKETQPCICRYPFSPKLPSHPNCHITVSRVPWKTAFSMKRHHRQQFSLTLLQCSIIAHIYIDRSIDFEILTARSINKQIQIYILCIRSDHFTQSCPTLCDPMSHSTPGLPVHHQLPEFTQTHIHQVGDAIQPSHPLSSPSPAASNPSQNQGLFQWVNCSSEVAKVLEFQLQHQSFQWTHRTYLL